jgi:hypothetical protein
MMNLKRTTTLAVMGALFAVGAGSATLHHGLADYDPDQPVNLLGTFQQVRYGNPHVTVQLETPVSARVAATTWHAVLAPPSRMQRRGIPEDRLKVGMTLRVIGLRHRQRIEEAKIERVVIGSDAVQIRY